MPKENIIQEALLDAGLRYISSTNKGFRRIYNGKGFLYLDSNGKAIDDAKHISRIQRLAIPPAWTDVWICPTANGHLQATGFDIKGRKQYRYHPEWTALRNKDKYANLLNFGKKLPLLERQIAKDLRRRSLSKEKVCALALAIMSKTYFRVGNESYLRQNRSHGLTTLLNRHAKVQSSTKLFFKFVGKKGVVQQSYLQEKSLIRILLKIKEIPGQRLLQYYDEKGQISHLDSGDINAYLKTIMGPEATCKDFRTWSACLLALEYFVRQPIPQTEKGRKDQSLAAIDYVASQLGNTRSVTRSHYIHPYILSSYMDGTLDKWIMNTQKRPDTNLHTTLRRKLLSLLSEPCG